MRTKLRFIIFLVTIALTAVGIVYGQDWSTYSGNWMEQSLVGSRDASYVDTSMELKVAKDGNVSGKIGYDRIVEENMDREASIEIKGQIKNGKLSCRFDDDDWGHAGTVELTFLKDQIKAKIKITHEPKEGAMWGFSDEDVVFIRNKTQQVKHTPLTKGNEKVILSFRLKQSKKIMTIAVSEKEEYMVYRFGGDNKIELEYPEKNRHSWEKFTYSYYFRGGGAENAGMDLNYLTFTNGNYTYKISEEFTAEDNDTVVGIRIKNNKTGKETYLQGDVVDCIGSLVDLRSIDQVKKEDLL